MIGHTHTPMGAITDLWKSERGLVAIALIVAATVGMALGRLTIDQWIQYTQWIFVTYAAGKTATGIVSILKTPAATTPPTPSLRNEASAPPASVTLVLCALGGLAMSGAAGCAGTQRNDALRASLTAVNAARDGFTTWDAQHQHTIVENSTTRAQADGAIANYYHERQPVLDGFEVVYRLLAVAATQTDDLSLKAALARSKDLIDAIKIFISSVRSSRADDPTRPLRRRVWTPDRDPHVHMEVA